MRGPADAVLSPSRSGRRLPVASSGWDDWQQHRDSSRAGDGGRPAAAQTRAVSHPPSLLDQRAVDPFQARAVLERLSGRRRETLHLTGVLAVSSALLGLLGVAA